jgi:site-specific recombinase XerD
MISCKLSIIDGKGGKDRVLWVSPALRGLIGRWLEVRPESTWLFPSRTGSQVHRQSVHRTIQNYAEKAGIPNADEVGPHTLRHTFATRLYRETKNIRLVQKALGHSDLSTTMIYTHIVDEELADAMQALGT